MATKLLFKCVDQGTHSRLKLFIETTKVDVNAVNTDGHNLLMRALYVENDRLRDRMFRYLLRRGVSPDFKDTKYSRNLLSWAIVLDRNEQALRILDDLAGESDLHDADCDGKSALHHATEQGNLMMVTRITERLVRFNQSVDIPDSRGLTPYLLANKLGHIEIASHLRNVGKAFGTQADPIVHRNATEWKRAGAKERIERRMKSRERMRANYMMLGKVTQLERLKRIQKLAPLKVVSLEEKLDPTCISWKRRMTKHFPAGSENTDKKSIPVTADEHQEDDEEEERSVRTGKSAKLADKEGGGEEVLKVKHDFDNKSSLCQIIDMLSVQSTPSFRPPAVKLRRSNQLKPLVSSISTLAVIRKKTRAHHGRGSNSPTSSTCTRDYSSRQTKRSQKPSKTSLDNSATGKTK